MKGLRHFKVVNYVYMTTYALRSLVSIMLLAGICGLFLFPKVLHEIGEYKLLLGFEISLLIFFIHSYVEGWKQFLECVWTYEGEIFEKLNLTASTSAILSRLRARKRTAMFGIILTVAVLTVTLNYEWIF